MTLENTGEFKATCWITLCSRSIITLKNLVLLLEIAVKSHVDLTVDLLGPIVNVWVKINPNISDEIVQLRRLVCVTVCVCHVTVSVNFFIILDSSSGRNSTTRLISVYK